MPDGAAQSRLTADDLEVGNPLPWDLYDARGTLIIASGAVINKEAQLLRLIERGAYRAARADDESVDAAEIPTTNTPLIVSPFDEIERMKKALGDALRPIHDRIEHTTPKALVTLARELRHLAWKHADAALGALLLDTEARYTEIHPLMVAIIGELVGRRLDLDDAARDSLCLASLTSNVSMLDLQEVLAAQDGPLSDKQRRAVRAHPAVSVRLLESIGVDDPAWLTIVRDHHERLDGTGYPGGKTADDIDQPTRIVALADRYSAMVLPREYRDGLHAQQAIREIFLERGAEVDSELATLFIKEMGVYPPGCFVTTQMGERAMVIRRGIKRANAPVISCYADCTGQRYRRPIVRDSGEAKAYAIRKVVAPEDTGLELPDLWAHVH